MSKALFLDRDGTLILDKDYLSDPARVEVIPGVPPALAQARKLGYRLFLFTNQSGIGRGLHTLAEAEAVNARMEQLLGLPSPLFDQICIAPEAPDASSLYRKPSPRFIEEMIAARGLDARTCWMVGDRDSDIQAGIAAGIGIAAVCTGKLTAADWKTRNYPGLAVYPNFPSFVATLS